MISLLFAFLTGCAPAVSCTESPIGDCELVETCCSSVECSYEADGETFDCDGTDCTAAATEVAEFCTE